jgi:hypothetical protein
MIEQAFAEGSPPAAQNLCATPDDESLEETEVFSGKQWRELDSDFLHRYRDALFWFTPEAFHYYLPAYLVAALVTGDENALYVHNLLFLIRPTRDDSLNEFRKERWEQLTDAQIQALESWLSWLLGKATPPGVFQREVQQALEKVRERYWWTERKSNPDRPKP